MGNLVERSVRVGDTLHRFIGLTLLEVNKLADALIKKSLADDQTVEENGASRWIEDEVVFDPSRSGSDAYTWSPDGNKVKVNRYDVTRNADGTLTRKKLRPVYRDYDSI